LAGPYFFNRKLRDSFFILPNAWFGRRIEANRGIRYFERSGEMIGGMITHEHNAFLFINENEKEYLESQGVEGGVF